MIQSGYTPQGGNSLTTQGMGFAPQMGPGGLPFDPSAAIREKLRQEAEDKAYERSMRERAQQQEELRYRAEQDRRKEQEIQYRNSMTNREAPGRIDPLAGMKAQDQYDMTLRSAAMRPTGLGAQMIPGMAVDPNLLPSRMRPAGSSFQGQMGPSGAALSPSAPPPPETSNRGFDFADPYSQAAVQRSAFGAPPVRR